MLSRAILFAVQMSKGAGRGRADEGGRQSYPGSAVRGGGPPAVALRVVVLRRQIPRLLGSSLKVLRPEGGPKRKQRAGMSCQVFGFVIKKNPVLDSASEATFLLSHRINSSQKSAFWGGGLLVGSQRGQQDGPPSPHILQPHPHSPLTQRYIRYGRFWNGEHTHTQ